MRIGNREFDNKGHYVWGVLNVTPDSFSDGGLYHQKDLALFRVEEMIDEGADIIDLGGESTRPGFRAITAEEEIERILPVLEGIKKNFSIPVSIDTYKSRVAEEALKEGADLINDIWGLKWDYTMAEVIAKYQVPCCLGHNRKNTKYVDLMSDIVKDLKESLMMAEEAGIQKENIILDPGIGFAKTYEECLTVLKHMEELKVLGCPLLLGASRKSVLGKTMDLPKKELEEATMATSVIAVMKGYNHLRVHDVKKNKRAITMAEAII